METQLQLFDPTDYRGTDGRWHIEVEMSDEEIESIQRAADRRNITFDEYVDLAIKNLASSLQCITCKKYRGEMEYCQHCGEIDY
jgi:hypothetical protein